MAKDKRDSKKSESAVGNALIPQSVSYMGAILFMAGMFLMYKSSVPVQSGAVNYTNYIGIALAVLGGILWFLSGMDRAQVIEWLRSGLTALALALIIRWAVAEPYRIPSGSMETTLHGDPRFGRGDRVFVNKWIYGLRFPFMNKRIFEGKAPERWDIVVFKTVEKNAVHKTLVKRIVGMPGEHIQIRDGKILVNGSPIPLSPSLPPDSYYTTPLDGPYGVQSTEEYSRVPEDHYLVLGDNSMHSRDGRYFGWLPRNHIVGRVASIWWPPPRWRDFTGFSKTGWWRGLVILTLLAMAARLVAGRLCPVHNPENPDQVDHLLVSFIHYGVHVPLMNRTVLPWRTPKRGDLVLYRAKSAEQGGGTQLYIGRIAGLPGEQVYLHDGLLAINDQEMVLPAPAPKRYEGSSSEARYGKSKSKEYGLVPEKSYFILADEILKEEMPLDSRVLGWVSQSRIMGRAFWCWWPPKRFGRR